MILGSSEMQSLLHCQHLRHDDTITGREPSVPVFPGCLAALPVQLGKAASLEC